MSGNRMSDIVERMKDVISHDHPGKKIKDNHVAHAIGMNTNQLAIKKTRGLSFPRSNSSQKVSFLM